jgi:hypothetical protein
LRTWDVSMLVRLPACVVVQSFTQAFYIRNSFASSHYLKDLPGVNKSLVIKNIWRRK